MKNSRQSDRELAHTLKTSQPTVSRIRRKLEEEGYINEYTVIPNFQKLGYHLFVLTFFTWNKSLSKDEREEALKLAVKKSSSVASNVVAIERGMGFGLNSDLFMASFHKDYTSHVKLMDEVKKSPYLDKARVESFIVNLDDEVHYRYLTFSTLAENLLSMQGVNEKKYRDLKPHFGERSAAHTDHGERGK
jgi:DNA-binding Lrp family transcriptional regulator